MAAAEGGVAVADWAAARTAASAMVVVAQLEAVMAAGGGEALDLGRVPTVGGATAVVYWAVVAMEEAVARAGAAEETAAGAEA